MAVSRKCLRASALARKNGTKCGYRALLAEGEQAARKGLSASSNPYPVGSEDALSWREGFDDIAEAA